MAVARKTKSVKEGNLTVAERVGQVFISSVSVKKNTNGTEFIPTPFGAVYANISGIKPGLYTAVRLGDGGEKDILALNQPTPDETLAFLCSKKEEYPAMTVAELKEFYNL